VSALAHELLGPHFKDAVLELNASDDRGIDVVRNKIKMFAQQKVTLPPGRHKVVILDEADSMTTGAQQALRRTMEIYSGTTRFALACNQSSKIIEPIQSRCAIVRFSKLSDQELLARVLVVAAAEGVAHTPDGLEAVVFTADGDMRQALNALQATANGFGLVTQESVFRVCDQPHPLLVGAIVRHCVNARIDEAYEGMRALCDMGYSASDIITILFRVVRNDAALNEFLKLEYIKVRRAGGRVACGRRRAHASACMLAVRGADARAGMLELELELESAHGSGSACWTRGPAPPGEAPRRSRDRRGPRALPPAGDRQLPYAHRRRRQLAAAAERAAGAAVPAGAAGHEVGGRGGSQRAGGAPLGPCAQVIGLCQMRVEEGIESRLQLSGLLANLCQVSIKAKTT
jgi:DNA polymerase III delta prime subunit